MIVVSDTSPIRALAFLERLAILEHLFGTVGILLRAKHAGFLQEIRPLLDRLCADLGFFLADALRGHILDQAGE